MTTNNIIRLPAVLMKTGLSKSSIYNLISAKDFPQRVSLGSRSMGFLENEVNGWIASRAARRAI